ncbi:MAG: PqqD family peptide modification chaperone [Bacteroidota bacterium]
MEQKKLVIQDQVYWRSFQDGYVIGSGTKDNGVYLANEMTVQILETIRKSQSTSVSDLVRSLTNEYNVDTTTLTNDIKLVTQQLLDRQILSVADLQPKVRSRSSDNAALFSHMLLELTWDCNLRCKHCYMEGGKSRPVNTSFQLFANVIREFKKLGGNFLTLSGGEPMLYDGWDILAQLATEIGLQLSIMTNGTYLDEERLSFIRSHDMFIGLGLDGIVEQTHDRNRGKGSYKSVMQALDLLERHQYLNKTTICFTPMGFNVYDLPGVVDMMLARGLPHLYVSILEDRGRAMSFKDQVDLTETQKKWLMQYLYQASVQTAGQINIEVTHHTDIFQRLLYDFDSSNLEFPRNTIRVASEGEVYLSAYLGAAEHCVGAIHQDSLHKMLNSEVANNIIESWTSRAQKIPKCQACNYLSICKGGSGNLAYSSHQDFYETDNFCDARIHLFDSIAQQELRAISA